MTLALLPPGAGRHVVTTHWRLARDGDPDALALFRRHYSHRPYADGRQPKLFVGPGEKTVLLTDAGDALFVWRKFISGDGQQGVNCAVFRNESAHLSSALILEAEYVGRTRWGGAILHLRQCPTGAQLQSRLLFPQGRLAPLRAHQKRPPDPRKAMTIAQLQPSPTPLKLTLHAQLTARADKTTADNKPFLDAAFSDGTGELKLRIWDNLPAYPALKAREKSAFVALTGTFTSGKYGWESKDFTVADLNADEIATLLEGDPQRRAFLEGRWQVILTLIGSMANLPLKQLCSATVEKLGRQYQRAAAARGNHHARRGGLVEHVSTMMESADALCRVYPQLNRSLLLAGVFFHDIGKTVENQYPERGFEMPYTARAELMGHISIGFELVRTLWLEVHGEAHREHLDALRHLILAHHGELAFGSPVVPKLAEATALHYIDQIDAKLEMFKACLAQPELAPGIHEKLWPLNIHAVDTPAET